jgi:hypothetical protein
VPDLPAPPDAGSSRPLDADAPARGLLQALYAASRLGALWGFESRLSVEALDHLDCALRAAATAQGEVVLRFADDLVYLNGARLRVDAGGFLAYQHLHERMRRRGIGEITMSATAGRAELARFLALLETRLEGTPTPDEAFGTTRSDLFAAAVTAILIAPPAHETAARGHLGPMDVRQATKSRRK